MIPFFTVIIPTFNREKTILRAVNSVLNQSFADFELIVVDDGSSDNTLSLLEGLNLRLIQKENGGVSSARNLGAKEASSNWLCFLDSDDEWLPNKLQILFSKIEENPKAQFFHSNEIWIRNGIRVNAMKKYDKGNVDLFNRSLEFCIISPSTSCIHTKLYNKYNGFDESLLCCEDYDLWLKILLENEIVFIEDFLIKKYGGHRDQLSTSFVDIDFFKVKSLKSILEGFNLKEDTRQLIIATLLKKCSLLLKGYLKHDNMSNYKQVLEIQNSYIS